MLTWLLVLFGTFTLILIFSAYIIYANLFLNTNINSQDTLWGIFGDTLGGTLNPVLTFLSFIAILYTIHIQNKELAATREELFRSANAQEKNLEKIQNQIDAQDVQKFENFFFKLIDLHESLSKDLLQRTIEVHEVIDNHDGDEEYIVIEKNYISHIHSATIEPKFGGLKAARQRLHHYNYIHGSYFTLIYQILKNIFIYKNKINTDDLISNERLSQKIKATEISYNEKLYANILRALIKKELLALLAINCATDVDKENYYIYRLLIERYCLFEHFEINKKIFNHPTKVEIEILKYYDEKSFGGNPYFYKLKNSLNHNQTTV